MIERERKKPYKHTDGNYGKTIAIKRLVEEGEQELNEQFNRFDDEGV